MYAPYHRRYQGRISKAGAIVSVWDPNAKLIDYCQSFDLNGGILPTYHAGVWTEEEGPFDTVLLGHFHSYDNIEQVMKRASKRICIISNTGQDIVGDIRSLLLPDSEEDHTCDSHTLCENYSHLFQMLYDYGIDPNVKIISDALIQSYENQQQMINSLTMILSVDDTERKLLAENVIPYMQEINGRLILKLSYKVALIYWNK